MEAERDVVRRFGPRHFLEACRVQDQQERTLGIRVEDDDAILSLSDGTEEPLDPASVRVGPRGELYLVVKREAKGGPFDAKMTRFAQTQLGPVLSEEDGAIVLATRRGRARLPM